MKILLVHASAGHGHKKAAEALAAALTLESPDVQIELMDGLDDFPQWVKKIYVGSYLYMITKAGWLWGISYAMSDCKATYPITAIKRRIFNRLFGWRLHQRIQNGGADAVVSTHFMPCEVAAAIRRSAPSKQKHFTVITDYLVHRFWILKETDAYLVAADATKTKLMAEGIPADKIRVTGIPVNPKFSKRTPVDEARRKLGIDLNTFTLLFTSGGMGATDITDWVKLALTTFKDIQVAVVAGSNPALKSRIDGIAASNARVKSLGFINNMDEWMDAADLIVGKAGGLTVTESLAKGKPMIIVAPVPGQEALNLEVLQKAGASYHAASPQSLCEIVRKYRESSEERAKVARGIQSLSRVESAREVARVVLGVVKGTKV